MVYVFVWFVFNGMTVICTYFHAFLLPFSLHVLCLVSLFHSFFDRNMHTVAERICLTITKFLLRICNFAERMFLPTNQNASPWETEVNNMAPDTWNTCGVV